VHLPAAEAAASALGDAPAVHAAVVPRRRILAVDDNRDALDTLAALLRLKGHDVRTAYDGRDALRLAASWRPDVVLLDIGMPDLDGYEVARRLRREPWGRALVLVALTGWGQQQDRRRSADAGFDAHLTKPASVEALDAVLAHPARSEAS
jgi:CheY-like chemotaxis protein